MVSKFQPRALPKSLLPESRKTRPEPNKRLDPDDRVFGLAQGGESRAWVSTSFGEAAEMRKTKLVGQDVVILWDGRTRTASAYAPETEGPKREPVTLAVDGGDPASPWVDQETGSRWSVAGRAVSGPRKGQTLRWLPGVMVKWYAWAASYPRTSLEASHQRPPAE